MRRLLQRMDTGVYPVGSRLPTEPALSREFAVSRTVVREALSRLKAHQRIQTRHGIGTFVSLPPKIPSGTDPASHAAPTLLDVLGMQEARIGLETEAAGMAALRRSDPQLLSIEAAMRDTRSALRQPDQDVAEADIEFHGAIAAATGNAYIRELQQRLSRAGSPCLRQHLARAPEALRRDFMEAILTEHQAILEAIRRRDEVAARNSMRQHMTHAVQRIQRLRAELELGQA